MPTVNYKASAAAYGSAVGAIGDILTNQMRALGVARLIVMALACMAFAPAFAVDCSAKLVKTVSGSSTTCEGFAASTYGHFWPIGMAATDCHGWQSTANGEVHDNAANNIRCSSDGKSLLYDQYAGNIDCSGTPTSKSFVLNECHQGIPPVLYDMAIDLSCCDDPNGANCVTGVPSATSAATSDETYYLNGAQCDASSSSSPASPVSSPSGSSASPPPASSSEDGGCGGGCVGGIIGGCAVPVLLLILWFSGAFGSKCPSPMNNKSSEYDAKMTNVKAMPPQAA